MAPAPLFASDDARILDRIRKGDEGALADLYRANRRPVAALVRQHRGTSEDAEDVLQEAIVVLWERVKTGRFEYKAKLGTFIYATAKNIWIRRLARSRREPAAAEGNGENPGIDPDPLEILMDDEETRIVRNALEKLGEPCKEVLLLFYWEELSMEEIASRLGFANADTAKSKKYQCKKALERLLEGALPRYG
ncbi:MAG: sigma-70 family RNA polymerase sigma factor [Bacteroidota bacterium]